MGIKNITYNMWLVYFIWPNCLSKGNKKTNFLKRYSLVIFKTIKESYDQKNWELLSYGIHVVVELLDYWIFKYSQDNSKLFSQVLLASASNAQTHINPHPLWHLKFSNLLLSANLWVSNYILLWYSFAFSLVTNKVKFLSTSLLPTVLFPLLWNTCSCSLLIFIDL